MSTAVKIGIIGAGSAQFSLGLVKDICLTESLRGSHITFMDIDEGRLDIIHKLATRYAGQLGADLTFDATDDRKAALQDADFVVNTAYVLGHEVEAQHAQAGRREVRLLSFRRQLRLLPPAAPDARRGTRHGAHLPGRLADPVGQPGVRRLHADDPRDRHQGVRAVSRPLWLRGDRPHHRHRSGAGDLAGARG